MRKAIAPLLPLPADLRAAQPAAQTWPQVDQPPVIAADQAPEPGAADFSSPAWARADAADRVTGGLVSQC